MPNQVIDPAERAARRFISTNARVDDPVALLAEEAAARPWTPEERRLFNEKFLAHPKARRPCLPAVHLLSMHACMHSELRALEAL